MAIFSGYHFLPIALAFKETQTFLSKLDGYDIPLSLWAIYSIAATAAQNLGERPAVVTSYLQSASQYYRHCAHVLPGLDQNLHLYSLVWYQQQVNPQRESFDGHRDHARMFERCLRLMRQWAAELLWTHQLSESDWIGIIYAYSDHPERKLSEFSLDTSGVGRDNQDNIEESNLNLRKKLLGRVFDEDEPPSKFCSIWCRVYNG